MNVPVTIQIPLLKNNQQVIQALESIAKHIDSSNLIAVGKKCDKLESGINSKLKKGLTFI